MIEDETSAIAGIKPAFVLIGDRELKLVLSAASPPLPDGISAPIAVLNGETDAPLPGAHVLVVYPNKTYLETRTDVFGHADFVLHTRLDDRAVYCQGLYGARGEQLCARRPA